MNLVCPCLGKFLDVSEEYTASSLALAVKKEDKDFILPKPTE
jgi:hypothetical protein